MSAPKFAAVTSSLLARKGEARPWNEPLREPFSWRTETPKVTHAETGAATAVDSTTEWKKCTVRISKHDYERLGILAVKQNTSRQHLLQDAVAQLFDGIDRQYGSGCACLGRKPAL